MRQTEAGLAVLAEALTVAHDNGEHHYEAELYRLKGELLLQQDSLMSQRRKAVCTRPLTLPAGSRRSP